ncbi:MAG: hydroxymethylbilane synthase [Pseudomonadota bacterium]
MKAPQPVRIGTRGSPLALYQAELIARALEQESDGALKGEIVTFTTKGDQLTSERLINSGGKGLFTREIDRAVDDGEVQLGVHSLKDVPSVLPDGQDLLAYPERVDPRDGLLTASSIQRLQDLPQGAILGTASLRRESQALALRPDLKVVPFRGRVETRIEKLKRGEADATFLAMAGLKRLDLDHLATPVSAKDMLPAAGQGIIAVAARKDHLPDIVLETLSRIDHAATRAMATAERAFLAELDGSCRTAMAAQLTNVDGAWHLRGEVLTPDGQTKWSARAEALISTSLDDLAALGIALANSVRDQAGGELPIFTD